MHGPHGTQIAYDGPLLDSLAVGGAPDLEPGTIAQAWSILGHGVGPASRWPARLFDEHAGLLDERPIAGETASRLLGPAGTA